MAYEEHWFASKTDLYEALSTRILDGLNTTHPAHLFVSGGSTPKALFAHLSAKKFNWKNVNIHLVDERYVAPDHNDSNAKLVNEHLRQNNAESGSFSPLYLGNGTVKDLASGIKKLDGIDQFDCVVLGMGGDSHTASLFPNQTATDMAFRDDAPVLALTKPDTAPHQRLGLTLTGFKKAKLLILHIEGEEKREVYEKAKALDLPISRVLNNPNLKTQVYWSP